MRVSQLSEEHKTAAVDVAQNPKSRQQTSTDHRFRDQTFREAVRLCLDYLGEKPTFASFKKYDQRHGSTCPIAWLEMAENILHPVFGRAKCVILDSQGHRVTAEGRLRYNVCDIQAGSEAEAMEIIAANHYEFGGWLTGPELRDTMRDYGRVPVVVLSEIEQEEEQEKLPWN